MDEMFSLLYPNGLPAESIYSPTSMIDDIAGLGLDALFHEIGSGPWGYRTKQPHPLTYFTSDIQTIMYRSNIVEDLYRQEAIYQLLYELLPLFEDLRDLQQRDRWSNDDTAASLYTVSEIELYLSCVERLYHGLCSTKPVSQGLQRLTKQIAERYESTTFQSLREETRKLSFRVRNIKSVTVGINFDPQLYPYEAGIIAVNDQLFRSGNLIDRWLRLDMKDDGFQSLAPLMASGKDRSSEQNLAMSRAINSALNTILKGSVREWRNCIKMYAAASSNFLVGLVPEIRFLLSGVSWMKQLASKGLPLCNPQAAKTEESSSIEGLYNPLLAVQAADKQESGAASVVKNNITFDENGSIYILTGPNQGGKTVFMQAVGIAQLLYQLGLFVPAFSATIRPVDRVLVHAQSQAEDHQMKGRFGEECSRLQHLFGKLTSNSLLLMDETFSSTSASEAATIAGEVLLALRVSGCRVIFATHLHELTDQIDKLNEVPLERGSRIDTLTAEIDTTTGQRSFVLRRSRPQGNSYARDIAQKYGVTYEQLVKLMNEN
ncbi:hypothetical protein H8B09_11690 [Paenibacillus sp. PR3]|uniref:DNA mismatch repair proteins mutS family domain-containing protein n=1 Tax=Paenibacillus terricola TaxID=2763503 RepID=A0ABR8MWI4_9BACL|nr:hypothetical protein [Paenibacillus terricola]MBD3919416.1 hypothetical protein [Paenibacillus terricola]